MVQMVIVMLYGEYGAYGIQVYILSLPTQSNCIIEVNEKGVKFGKLEVSNKSA